ncbi:MAG: site-specific integrase [Bacteroidota bacterium]|nr:site-specific integrase [Bacteroidota bacterium]
MLITLQYAHHRNKEWIKVLCDNDNTVNKCLVSIKSVWSKSLHCWLLPCHPASVQNLKKALPKICKLDVSKLKASLQQRKALQIAATAKAVIAANLHKKNNDVPIISTHISIENNLAYVEMRKMLILKGYSANTIKTYCTEWKYLLTLLGHKHNAADLTKNQLQSYLLYLIVKKGYSEHHIHTAVNTIKFYFEHVLNKDRMLFDLPRPKRPLQLPKVHDSSNIEKIIKFTENKKHQAMLMLAYSTGIRLNEIINVKLTDIDSKRMVINIIKGKGKKDRQVLLSPKLLEHLRKYFLLYKPKVWLFEGADGGQYGYTSVQQVFKQAKERAGIKMHGGIHTLRHSFATHLLENGTDITIIKKLLGHNDLKTTLRYTHVSNVQIQKVVSPLDKLDL